MAKEVKPGQAIPVRLEACLHPCLSFDKQASHQAIRCPGSNCEAAAVLYYTDVVGMGCPGDVFAEFDPTLCVYAPPVDIAVGPILKGGVNYENIASLLVPYLSNEQADEIAGGASSDMEIWDRIDPNQHYASRFFWVNISAGAADAPALCDDPDICDCREVAFGM